ncbi:hypothetical protein C7M84_019821 [Penaeus vannamei]|uniref:Uncharacterized protein n=1 Tax=Penaeus vannamei TaxID=6689 RepID=A0A3R7LRC2_PENVA|nr:hypothetical protein C7M84_019821 [Penaeus vannamei]
MINPLYESLNDAPPVPRPRIYLPGLSAAAGLRSGCPHGREPLFASQSSLLLTSKEEFVYDVPRAIHAPALYYGASSSRFGGNLLCLSSKSLCLGNSPPYVSSESSFSAGSLCCGASSPRPGAARLVAKSPSLSSGSSSVSLSSSYLSASSAYSNEREIFDLASSALCAREERAEDATPLICSSWANPVGGLYDVPSAIRYRCTFPLELQKFCEDMSDPETPVVRQGVFAKGLEELEQDAVRSRKCAAEKRDARKNEENKDALAEQMSGLSQGTGAGEVRERSDEISMFSPRFSRSSSSAEGGLYDIPRLIHAASQTAGDEPERSPRSKERTLKKSASKECPAMASGAGDFVKGKPGADEAAYDVPRNLRRNLTFTSRAEGKLSETSRSRSFGDALSGLVVEDPESECANARPACRRSARSRRTRPRRPLTPPPKFNFTEPVSRYDVLEKASGLPRSSQEVRLAHGGNGIYYTLQVKGKEQKVLDGLSDDSSDMGDSEGVEEDCMSSLFRARKDASKRLCDKGDAGGTRRRRRATPSALTRHVVTTEPSGGFLSTWSDQDHGLGDADHYSAGGESDDSGVGSGPEISLGSESLVLNPAGASGST